MQPGYDAGSVRRAVRVFTRRTDMVTVAEHPSKDLIDSSVHFGPVREALELVSADAAAALMADCGLMDQVPAEGNGMSLAEICEKHAEALRLMYRGQ